MIIHLKGKHIGGFCSIIGHITPGCATKKNIGRKIIGDDLIFLLKDKCAFESIENDQVSKKSVQSLTDQKSSIFAVNNCYVPLNHVITKDQT